MRYALVPACRLALVPVFGMRLRKAAHRAALMGSVAFGALLRLSTGSFAEPSGGVVVQGQAGITQAGSLTTISQASDKAIINWQSFSIGRGETVTFNQPSVSSVTLNRVIGNEQSVISGALNANGQLFLVNSNGIVFNRGAQVNVGGLVASTLDISDANFMAGHYTFEGSSQAAVINRGHIRASNGGYVALLGKTVSNDGVISATLGTVAMASGRKITLNFEGNSLIDVTIDEGTLNALVENKRAIKADGGRVILTAKAADALLSAQVNNSGIIQARSMSALKGGHGGSGAQGVRIGTIKLSASGGSVSSTGRIDASARKGGNGGTVSLAATGGTVTLAGEVDVSSLSGTGGVVTATGQDVALTAAAAIKADGATGGTILIGGDRYGGNDPAQKLIAETLANAATVTVAAGATLSANGSNGNGGNIVVWSDQHTDYAGSITATGAGNGNGSAGNGGFAEVSSHGVLDFTGSANLASANGVTGTLLLDPYNITISNGATSGNASATGGDPSATSVINVGVLVGLLANANVTISTGSSTSAGADAGDITIASALNWTTPHTLTLTAANDITINGSVSWGTGGGLTATATGGNITVNAPITWGSGTLALNAGRNVYVNDVLTASGTGSFAETNGTGTNTGGQGNGFYLASDATGYTGRLDISGTGTVTFGGANYTVINTAAQLRDAQSNPNANYVLGSNLGNLSYSDLATLGFGSASPLIGNFIGLGHTLSITPTADLTISNPVLVTPNISLTHFDLTSTSDLNVNASVTWSANLLSLNAANNINVNAIMTMTNNASLAVTYGTGVQADGHTPYGLYTAQGSDTSFAGKVNISGYGSVWLQNQLQTVITASNLSVVAADPAGHYVLGSDLSVGVTPQLVGSTPFTGTFDGLGHVINSSNTTDAFAPAGGVFGTIGSTGRVSNFGLTNAVVRALNGPSGLLANENDGTITNSFAAGRIGNADFNNYNGEERDIGGLVGINNGVISNVFANVAFPSSAPQSYCISGCGTDDQLDGIGTSYTGGLVAVNGASGLIINSRSNGGPSAQANYSGGLVGVNYGSIDTSYSTGNRQVQYIVPIYLWDGTGNTISYSFTPVAGGLVGWNAANGSITNSYSTVSFVPYANNTASYNVAAHLAGFAGRNDGSISNAYASGTIGTALSRWSIAGFVYENSGTINGVYSAVTLQSVNIAANASAFSKTNSGTITNAYWDSSRVNGATETASSAAGLSATAAATFSSYTGFDPNYWGTSTDGHPILYTMPIYVLPVANSTIQYGSTGVDINSALTVRGLQWGETLSSYLYNPAANLLSANGQLNAGTYSFSQVFSGTQYTNVSGAFTIAPRQLTLATTGIIKDKTYDGTIAATIDVTAANSGLVNLANGETLVVTYSDAYFFDRNAGSGKTGFVTVNLADGTGLASNYIIVNNSTTANIAAKTLQATYSASDKTYDGTTSATVAGTLTVSDILPGDQVGLSASGQFASANAGSHLQVTASLTGADAGNYSLVASPVYASITPRPIELSGVKLTDGSATATASQLQAVNLIGNDSVTLSGSVTLASGAAGLQSISSVSGLGALGNSNYTLVNASGSVAVLSSYLPELAPSGASAGITFSNPNATSLTVTQTTATGIINWTSFNIAPGYSVTYNQPSATAITLNRIIGNEVSVIAGSLTANGRLIFINSAGILFAAGSTVNVGGLIASTQSLADSDFLAGRYNFGTNAATGSINVLGAITINQTGSYAAFLGNGVSTAGSIRAPGGTILLAGGEGISLTQSGTGLSGFSVATADKPVSAGGILDVSSTSGAGGVIATQGGTFAITDTLQASATGASGFANGYWLIQTNGDFAVGTGGLITGSVLNRMLAQVSVTASATAVVASADTAASAGDININDAVSGSANTLTLRSPGSIYVNNVMSAGGTANFAATTGSGVNADGSTKGIFTAFGDTDGTFAGRIDFASSGSVTLNGQSYSAIRTLADLVAINGSSQNFFLAGDIVNYVGAQQPYTTALVTSFNGVLEGFGHVIRDLRIVDTTQNGFDGLIGTLGAANAASNPTAAIRNLGLVNLEIVSAGTNVGGLVAANRGIISNSFVTGSISAAGNVGGLVGLAGLTSLPASSRIQNSYANVTLVNGYGSINGVYASGATAGGLIGSAFAGTVINSHATGSLISTNADNTGGLIGINYGTINNSWANLNISASGTNGAGNVGGLVGFNASGGWILNGSYSESSISAVDSWTIGGVAGRNEGKIIGTVDGIDHGRAYYLQHPEEVRWISSSGDITVTITATSGSFSNYSGGVGLNFGVVSSDGVYTGGVISYLAASGKLTIKAEHPVIISNVGGLVGSSSLGSVDNGVTSVEISVEGCSVCLNINPIIGFNPPSNQIGSITYIPPQPPDNGGGGGSPPPNPGNGGLNPGNDGGSSANPGNGSGSNAGSGANNGSGTGSNNGSGTGTGGSSPNTGTNTGSNGGGSSGGGATAGNAAAQQASRAGASAIAGAAGGNISGLPDAGAPASNAQTASLGNQLSSQISGQVPATTPPPKPSSKDKKEHKNALNTQKKKPDSGYGAEIRSIVIDGQTYDLQSEKPKDDAPKSDAPKSDAPKGDAPKPDAPKIEAPAAPPAGDKPQ